MKRILSIDGGGVRGALTTCFLIELEKQVGKPCREIFDMAAGTSTGALIASAIAAGIPASTILEIYQQDAPKVFGLSPTLAWPKRIISGHAFESSKIIEVLQSRFGSAAAWTLNDCPIRVLLCAIDMKGHPWYFVKDNPRNAGATGKLSLIQCAAASAAALTYLSQVYVDPLGGTLVGWCADGGLAGLANPAYAACVEAFFHDDFDPADTQVISMGTGQFADSVASPPLNFLESLSLSIDGLLYNAGIVATQTVDRHWPGIQTRMNWDLPRSIDMADAGAIPDCVNIGQSLAPKVDFPNLLKL